jgi:hypothetical protein
LIDRVSERVEVDREVLADVARNPGTTPQGVHLRTKAPLSMVTASLRRLEASCAVVSRPGRSCNRYAVARMSDTAAELFRRIGTLAGRGVDACADEAAVVEL